MVFAPWCDAPRHGHDRLITRIGIHVERSFLFGRSTSRPHSKFVAQCILHISLRSIVLQAESLSAIFPVVSSVTTCISTSKWKTDTNTLETSIMRRYRIFLFVETFASSSKKFSYNEALQCASTPFSVAFCICCILLDDYWGTLRNAKVR